MRLAAIACFVVAFAGCSSRQPIGNECPTVSRIGTSPNCQLSAQCVGANTGVELDCSAGNGSCICSMNGVVGKTVSSQTQFCDTSTSTSDALNAANDACGWNL